MRRARAVAAIAATLALGACPGPGAEPPARSEPRPVAGGHLVLHIAEDLDALDPHAAGTPASWSVARLLHRGLFAYPDVPGSAGSIPVPDLAAGSQREGTAIEITIEDGARFSGGEPVRATDVVASLRRLRTSRRGIGPLFARALAEVTEVDERVVRIESDPTGTPVPMTELLAHPQAAILPADTPAVGRDSAPEGAGPYELSRQTDDSYELVRRSGAQAGPRPAYVARVTVRISTRLPGPTGIVLDPGPPDLSTPGAAPRGRSALVATLCVRYLDLAASGLGAPARRALAGRLRARLQEVGTGPVARGPVHPILGGDEVAPAASNARVPRFDLVVSRSPRDQAEARHLGRIIPEARIRSVSASTRYGSGVSGAALVRTWCADLPSATQMTTGPAAAPASIPLWWPHERVEMGERVRGFVGSVMFPRGDPAALWLAPDGASPTPG